MNEWTNFEWDGDNEARFIDGKCIGFNGEDPSIHWAKKEIKSHTNTRIDTKSLHHVHETGNPNPAETAKPCQILQLNSNNCRDKSNYKTLLRNDDK